MKIATFLTAVAPLALMVTLGGCDGSTSRSLTVVPAASPTPTPSPTVGPASFNVQPCLDQIVPGTTTTVAGLVVPDVLTLNFAVPSGFPNGRQLSDPVIDITLAVILLKLSVNSPGSLALLPVNPSSNDLPFRPTFPYLAAAQGTATISGTAGTNFNFRTDPPSAYTQVDRMGMPAVATALVASSRKNAYNDGSPAADASGTYMADLKAQLTTFTNAVADDVQRLGLTPCAVPA